jgi:hypothetical protein
MAETVQIFGMRELRSTLKRCEDAERQAELKRANVEVAELVIRGARRRAGSRMQRSTAARMKASRSLNRAAVRMGGRPYDMGANFGAYQDVPRRRRTGSYLGYNWAPERRSPDYMLYATIEAERAQIVDFYADAIEDIFRKG